MSERNGFRENEAKEDEGTSWLSIREAASVLGVSERAVQMQAKSGKLPSRKSSGRWQVSLPAKNETKDSRSRSEETKPDFGALLAEKDAHIADLQKQLDERNRAEGELRRLMLIDKQELIELRQRVALLAAPSEDPTTAPDDTETTQETPEPHSTGPRRWWQVWKRG